MPKFPRLTWLLVFWLAGCALAQHGAVADQPAAPAPPIITFWCGPPLAELDDARAAEIAAAGFTVIGPPCEGGSDQTRNSNALAVACRHGLKMWINDRRFDAQAPTRAGWEADLDAAVAQYRGFPALGAYFVKDEPSVKQFDDLAQVVARLRAQDPNHPAYVNLFPDFANRDKLGADSYDDYLARFLSTVNPALLSFDYYPFLEDHDRDSFFANLAAVSDLAQHQHVSFMLIVQAMPHWKYRDVTEAELAWQVFHALAFGARGVSYFAYWTPVDVEHAERMKFHYGLVEDGKPTLHYFQIARLNRIVRSLLGQLQPYRFLNVADSTGEIGPPFPIGPIDAIAGGPVTAGLFAGPAGELAVLLVNRDYRYAVKARLEAHPGAAMPEVYDAENDLWHPSTTLAYLLPPGQAKLLRWRSSPPSG